MKEDDHQKCTILLQQYSSKKTEKQKEDVCQSNTVLVFHQKTNKEKQDICQSNTVLVFHQKTNKEKQDI